MGDALTSLLSYRNLQDSQEKFKEAQRIAHVGYWDRDIAGNRITLSEESHRIFGISVGESAINLEQWHKLWLTLIHPEDLQRVSQAVSEALRGGLQYNVKYRIIRPGGEVRCVHSEANVTRDEAGHPIRMMGIMWDITEQKQAEEEIRHLNQELEQRVIDRTAQLEAANKELEAFAYSISHDLRAPLRHIGGFIELLEKKTATTLDAQSQHYLTVISSAAKHMGTLIDDLLSFSRMGRFEISKTQLDIRRLVQDVIQELGPEVEGRNIDWHIADLPTVTGDPTLLRIVLVNLISNAVKFTQPRQQAEIEVGCLSDTKAEVILFVRDNGVGFDMNYVDKLFGVFQRLHRADEFEGTGIGLATVRRIIDRHGGRTWAQGEIDHGATFYFSLPHYHQGA